MKLTLHLLSNVPAVIVPSHAPSEDPSDCAGHAAAVPSRRSSATGRDDCTGGSGIQMGHVSSPRGLVGLHLLGASQVRWSSAGCSIEALHAQGLIKIDEHCPGCSISGPSSTRQVPVVSEILPEICSPMFDTSSGGLGENYDESHGSRGNWREIEACPLAKKWTATTVNFGTSPPAHLNRSYPDVSRRKVGRIAPEAKQVPQVLKERALHLDEDVKVNDAQVVHPNDCFVPEIQHHHGSQLLATVMDRWLSSSRLGSKVSSFDNVHPHFRFTYMPSVLLELKQRDLVPPPVPLLP